MIIRLRSKDGNFRFELDPSADASVLQEKIIETVRNAEPRSISISNQPRGGETPISRLSGKTLESLGLRHGDLLFVSYQTSPNPDSKSSVTTLHEGQHGKDQATLSSTVQEDPVDTYWRKEDGKIKRGRDAKFCSHGAKAMCEYCSPLEPFDPAFHADHSIKHLSFHAYLRKLSPSPPPSNLPLLNPVSYKVKVPCPSGSHPSWPSSICTACQPSAITLHSQQFRMVDHLEFSSDSIIERFLQAWRATGTQRFGWLIGHYEPYLEVPMGVKAVVEAIHEPPQEGEVDGLTLGLPWPDSSRIDDLARSATQPLQFIGHIFTDLTPDEEDKSKVNYKRHPQSFYLSSLEAIFAATLQLQHPNASRASSTGSFSSRFVTAVLTGTPEGAVDIAAYQVSEQACAMLDADMIEASVEPGLVRVKEEETDGDTARYIPEVFFRYKNEYGRDVQKSAKPAFPVEYLLVNITHGFPKIPAPVFKSLEFPIENRPGLEDIDFGKMTSLLIQHHGLKLFSASTGNSQDESPEREIFLKWLSDWHLVSFLGATGILTRDDIAAVIKVATAHRNQLPDPLALLSSSAGWLNLIAIAKESHAASSINAESATVNTIPPTESLSDLMAPVDNSKICPHCTYENAPERSDCEVCGLPIG